MPSPSKITEEIVSVVELSIVILHFLIRNGFSWMATLVFFFSYVITTCLHYPGNHLDYSWPDKSHTGAEKWLVDIVIADG